jgi:heme-degrading monooxygenase HmoA
MSFQADAIDTFEGIFEESCQRIRAFPGCQELTLLQDIDQPHRFSTYSLWENPESLEAYRQSDLFRSTWAKTKVLFSDRPTAVSYRIVRHLS